MTPREAEPGAEGGWQSIETAPRDRAVLIWDANQHECRVAKQLTALEDGEVAWVYAQRFSWEGEPAIAFIAREPTHWMPLPDPPPAAALPTDMRSLHDEVGC